MNVSSFLISMLATNFLGLMLLFVLFVANYRTLHQKEKENRILLILFGVALFGTLNEILADVVDGMPGTASFYLSYISNSLGYLMVTVFAFTILLFLHRHFFHGESLISFILMSLLALAVFGAVIVNLFVPFIFQINENNLYIRLYGYYLPLSLDVFCLIYSLFMYLYALKKGKTTRFFPYYLFLVPVVFGIFFQTFVSNVSVLWPSFIIGLAGMIASIKSERIFRDELTGLLNRAYFNYIVRSMQGKKRPVLTGIMLDINDFKSINDCFGHDFGDKALTDFASLLMKSVGHFAPIIRLSGDEFVVLIRTADKKEISRYIDHINLGFEEFNNSRKKPYELFASLGYATYLKGQSPEEFLQNFDENMYKEKKRYHSDQK